MAADFRYSKMGIWGADIKQDRVGAVILDASNQKMAPRITVFESCLHTQTPRDRSRLRHGATETLLRSVTGKGCVVGEGWLAVLSGWPPGC